MGIVIPFERRAQKRTAAREDPGHELNAIDAVLKAAARDGCARREILIAARPLLEQCRDRYGFTVMRTGLPTAPDVLGTALLTLARGLRPLDEELGGRRPCWAYGVYFSEQERLSWFEDGYGRMTGLAVPIDVDAVDLTRFVRQRIWPLRR
jgi:hypothetical protein